MSLRLAVLKSVFKSYNEKAFPLIFFFMVLVYFMIKDKRRQRSLLIYGIFGILLLVTPFIGNKIITFGAGEEANWPVYGILCTIPLTAYAAAELIQEQKTKKGRLAYAVLFLLVIQLGYGFSVTGGQFVVPQKMQKISQTAQTIGAEVAQIEEAYVMAPVAVAGQLREYSEDIRVFYRENYEELQKDLLLLLREAASCGCNCIILSDEYNNEEVMLEGGYQLQTGVNKYSIYRRADL